MNGIYIHDVTAITIKTAHALTGEEGKALGFVRDIVVKTDNYELNIKLFSNQLSRLIPPDEIDQKREADLVIQKIEWTAA